MLLPLVYSVHGCGRILILRLREMVGGSHASPIQNGWNAYCAEFSIPITTDLRPLGSSKYCSKICDCPVPSGLIQCSLFGDVYNLNEALHNLIYKQQEDFIAKDTAHFSTISTRAKSEQLFQPILHSLEVEVLVSGGFDCIQLIGPYILFFVVDEDICIAISDISLHCVFNSSGSNVNVQAVLKLSNGKAYFRNTPQYEGTDYLLGMSSQPALKNESTNHKNNNTWTDVTICGDAGIIAKWFSSISFVSHKNWNSPSNGGEYANLNIGVKRIENCAMEDLLDTLLH